GIGELLAEGSLRAAEQIGGQAMNYVHEVKGQEVPMHDPRVKVGVGLQYATASYGADHMKAMHDTAFATPDSYGVKSLRALGIYDPVDPLALGPEKVQLYYNLDLYWTLIDMLGACYFGYAPRGPVPLDKLLELVQAVTGTDINLRELMDAAERGIDMARVFNHKAGLSQEADRLPDRFYQDFTDGPLAGQNGIDQADFAEAVHLRYQMMGWDPETALPTAAKLAKLGIAWIK
ncbi:MAG: aldehyde ferredoxin oxidoreductase C-terminal domain-containing protein, partial [Bacillota bacterium]